jgi:precorrin-6A/cobalt-precorrin-6A reductase
MRRVLILGGTGEAFRLAARVADEGGIAAVLSLAGRTRSPRPQPLPTRSGGFGGVAGLRAWLREHGIARVVDATHPFAEQMSHHAVQACAGEGIPLLVLTRPGWQPIEGDRWTMAADAPAAAAALGPVALRVFLTVGRLSLGAFAAAPAHDYLVRAIDPPGDLSFLPRASLVFARPPFTIDAERALLLRERIEVIVTKDSGGEATYAKMAAARDLGVPAVVIERPRHAGARETFDIEEALVFLRTGD